MTIRDDVHRLINELAEDELSDAQALLEALRAQDRAGVTLAQARDEAVDHWQPAAIREGIEYAASEDAEWVSHEDISAWLNSWGTNDELPPPDAQRRECVIVRWSLLARHDLQTLRASICALQSRRGGERRTSNHGGRQSAVRYPHLGRPGRQPDSRELVVPRTPYLLIYAVGEQRVEIVRVLHGAQRWPP